MVAGIRSWRNDTRTFAAEESTHELRYTLRQLVRPALSIRAASNMHGTELKVASLPHRFLDAALILLNSAFERDPTLGWCLFAENPGFDERRANYLESYLKYHYAACMPALGAWRNDDLVAVSYFAPASCCESPRMLAELGRNIAIGCGASSLSRIDLLRETPPVNSPAADCSRIEFIGVSPVRQGAGVGSALLGATLSYLGDIERHGTISLETGEPRNIPFYERHGFAVKERMEYSGLTQYRLQTIQPATSSAPEW
jgi:GNAT superfamily N-acetyltransferase